MPDANDSLYKAYDTNNRLAAEAARLEKERDQLKKELYDLRKVVWTRLKTSENTWAEIDRLMGDWYPDKDTGKNKSGDNPADTKIEKLFEQIMHWPEED